MDPPGLKTLAAASAPISGRSRAMTRSVRARFKRYIARELFPHITTLNPDQSTRIAA